MKNILKHKNKIIVGALILAVLTFVFWWGGNSPSIRGWNNSEISAPTENHLTAEEKMQLAEEISKSNKTSAPTVETQFTENTEMQESIINQETNEEYSSEQGVESDQTIGKDEYQTNSVPEGKPIPINPEDTKVTEKAFTCTLCVRCDTILQNIANLKEEKIDIVPKDSIIFAEKEVVFYEGESVFNVLLREMKKNKIHFEFVNTPIYNSAYVEGIANIYEFDCGELSGWMYKVNGWFPNYGCSRYALKQGDKIEWLYTCDLGNDIGGYESARNGK